ncbi:MAG: hypothetical protein JST16_03015 [Bdellovibrionales bacterium]|nr:hypothetical protein [Bdellovibrionales bacterium]
MPRIAQATPQVIRVDGSVFDSTGAPVTASKDIQIKAYDAATAGTLLWTSSVFNTSVSSGRFTINLDAAAGSPSLVDRLGERAASQAVYFQIEVDSGAANGSMDTPAIVLPRIRAKGTAFALSATSADALKGVTATVSEINYLAGTTANVQSQINTLSAGGSSASKVDKAGDSMSGALQVGANITSTGTVQAATLNSTGATASRFALFDSSKNLTSSASIVTDTEFGYLSGVTANLGANLHGLTANVQTQLNAKQASLGYSPVSKLGDSMSGALQVGANITSTGTVTAATINGTGLTASRALVTDGSKNLGSSSVTSTELGYLSGVTGSIQSQLDSKASGTFDGFSNLTDAATISVGGSLGRIYKVTLGGNRTMGNPTNLVTGRMYTFVVGQDATGGRALTWGSSYKGSIPAVNNQTLVGATVGTTIGNMTTYGGLAGCFDGVTSQSWSGGCNYTSQPGWGYVGKDWGSGNTKSISRFIVYATNDYAFSVAGDSNTIKLQGSDDNSTWTDLYTSSSFTSSNSQTIDVSSGITNSAYRYHRIGVYTAQGSYNVRAAEVVFYETTAAANSTAVYPFVSDGTFLYYAVDPGPNGSGGNSVTSYTASRAMVTDSNGSASASSVTSTELGYLSGVTANLQTQLNSAVGVPTGASTGRLTVVSATPVPDTDQSAKTTLYLTSGVIDLWDGSKYVTKQYDEINISLAGASTASRMYAVYCYLSGGVPTLELESWTNNTTRATALVQDTKHSRIKYKSGAKDRRWVGDILTNSTGGQTDDTLVFRGVFNAHNRVSRPIKKFETTNSWSYSTDSWRAMNNDSTNNRATVCTGDTTRVNIDVVVTGGHYSTSVAGVVGVGVNSTTADAGSIHSSGSVYYGYDSFQAVYKGYLSPGANIIYPLETGGAGTTFYGDNGGTTVASGMIGDVEL